MEMSVPPRELEPSASPEHVPLRLGASPYFRCYTYRTNSVFSPPRVSSKKIEYPATVTRSFHNLAGQ